jgi:hypothetical protein
MQYVRAMLYPGDHETTKLNLIYIVRPDGIRSVLFDPRQRLS